MSAMKASRSKSEYEKLGASPGTILPDYLRKRKNSPPPPPLRRSRSRYREPTSDEEDDFLQSAGMSVGYVGRRGNPNCSNKYLHIVWWKNGCFTMDGKNWRKIDDNPLNQSFWKSVKHSAIPDEFKEEGRHEMCIVYMEPDEEWEPMGNGGKQVYEIKGDEEM